MNKKGQNIIEYILIISVIAAGIVVGVKNAKDYMKEEASVTVHADEEGYWGSWKSR